MNVSLGDFLRDFEQTGPRQVLCLLGSIEELRLRRKSLVKARFLEQHSGFEKTLEFLKRIDWVRERGELLRIRSSVRDRLNAFSEGGPMAQLVFSLTATKGTHQGLLSAYLRRFDLAEGVVSYQPVGRVTAEERAARNFLMEAGAIKFHSGEDKYSLAPEAHRLLLWARGFWTPATDGWKQRQEEHRRIVGLDAEEAVVKFEKGRLGPRWSRLVSHFSKTHPFASFDIESVTIVGDQAAARFIEVKAVSPDTYEFFWSPSELEAAKLLHSQMYLYLVPVLGRRRFDLEAMMIIRDPFEAVWRDATIWMKEPGVVRCRRN